MKIKRLLFTLIITVLIIGCVKNEDLPHVVKIHQNWKYKKQTDTEWNIATVPGNIHSDLLYKSKIIDPFIGTNEANAQWVSNEDWHYQTIFELKSKTLKKSHIELSFEGLDTYATIYLNDSILGKTNNAFRTWTYNIKSLAKAKNTLRVQFENVKTKEKAEAKKLAYTLPESPRVFTRKAQFQYGWDWGPKLNTMGIWKPVTLTSWDDMNLDDVYLKQAQLNDSFALLEVAYTITSDEENTATFEIQYDNNTHKVKSKLKKGRHTYTTHIEIQNPKRWWTHNLGTPHLYEFNFSLKKDKTLKAKSVLKKGLRTIELLTDKDEKGKTFYFKLNDVPVFMKGANYIPQHSLQNKVTNAHYEKILNDVLNANMNMLRVWGGGIYENDIFYDLCDEKGILVWQDFMFACAMYPGDKDFLDNVAQEATDQVMRLRNHSSIALWCGNNENAEGWNRWGWQADKTASQKAAIWKGYLAVFDSILPKTIAELNPEIPYWESSPKYGRGNPKFEFEGDAHDWWVWHDAYPFEHFEAQVPRFMSEFGFQSYPSYEAIRYFTQEDSIDLSHDSYATHQRHASGFQLIRTYMERDYIVPDNGADYVYFSQLLQAKGITMGIEAQRRAKPYCMGSLYWQLNDCWPAISWSSIDFMGNWKALHYKAKKSFENVLISSVMEKDTIKTYVISDKLQVQKGKLKLTFLDFNGKTLHEINQNIIVEKNKSELLVSTAISNLNINHKNVVLKQGLISSSGKTISSSLFYLAKPKDLELPDQNVSKTITKIKDGFRIQLKANALQKDVFLHTKAKGHFEENFFDILAGETVFVVFLTSAKNIDDLEIRTLNGIK